VQRDQKVENGGHICKMIFEVLDRYWYTFIGMNENDTTTFRKPFLTSRHVYDDLRAGLNEMNEVRADVFRHLGDGVLEDNHESAAALTELINNQLQIHDALGFISIYTNVFVPLEVGKIQSAASSVIKPGEKMDVMLSQSTW